MNDVRVEISVEGGPSVGNALLLRTRPTARVIGWVLSFQFHKTVSAYVRMGGMPSSRDTATKGRETAEGINIGDVASYSPE